MKLYKFKSLLGDGFLHSLDAIVNKRLYLSTCDQMNDPNEGGWSIELEASERLSNEYQEKTQKLRTVIDRTRFTSFTDSYNNELLWVHYAGGFSGVALEYEIDPRCYDLRAINYCEKYQITLTQIDQVLTTQKLPQEVGLLLNKSMCWSYENEYRLFGKSAFVDLSPQRVIFGVRNLKYDDVFRQITKKYGITISYLQKHENHYSYFDVTNYEILDD